VVEVAIERRVPFVCVPFGTRNHFARDLGLDRDDPVAALAAFSGVERLVDVGWLGDRVFLNNVSLGLYAALVERRERHRRRGELLARVRALCLSARERHPTKFAVDGVPVVARVLLIANNEYQLDAFSLGERSRLDGGALHLYVAKGLLPSGWQTLAPRGEVSIESERTELPAAIDGEQTSFRPPLQLSLQSRALRVLLPAGAGR
jgi:diacylglycerol kinase family enzyme